MPGSADDILKGFNLYPFDIFMVLVEIKAESERCALPLPLALHRASDR